MNDNSQSKKHKNEERTVKCPVEGCDAEKLARGIHLHVMRSVGDGHGEQGDVPEHLDFDNLETVGSKSVEMNYPDKRDTEKVARMCPYCERPFRGKQGVMIHLGQTAGRKNHPEGAADRHELDDFPVVHVDENDNIVEIIEEGKALPSTKRRMDSDQQSPDPENILNYIEELEENGMEDEAARARKLLLGEDSDDGGSGDSGNEKSLAAGGIGTIASYPSAVSLLDDVLLYGDDIAMALF